MQLADALVTRRFQLMSPYDYESWLTELRGINEEMNRFKITILAFLHAPDDLNKATSEVTSVNNTINHCMGIIDCRIGRLEKILQHMKDHPQDHGMTPEQMKTLLTMTEDGHA